MKKNSLFISFLTIFLSLFVFSCSNLETLKTTSINIRIPLKSIIENNSEQNTARAVDSVDTEEDDSTYELRVTLNIDGEDIIQSEQGTTEELSKKVFTFSELPVGAVVLVGCDVLKEDKLIWSGKSESIVISEGINNVDIKMKKIQQEDPPIDEHKHTFSEKWTSDESYHWHSATCEHKDEVEGKAEHKWDNGVVEIQPTETDDGEMTYTCEICGCTKQKAIPALGHSHTIAAEWTTNETHHWHEASCKIESHREGKAEHKWDNGVVERQPTETDDGETIYTCEVCGYTKKDTIPALGHSHTIAAEWTTNETHHWHEASCKIESHREGKAEHKWDSGVVTRQPTETDDGEITYTCTDCGHTKKDTIPALGHSHTIAAEWTSNETHHWHEASCKIENHRDSKAEHKWDNGVVERQPTEEADGEITYTCEVCGHTKSEAIPALGHSHTIAAEWTTNETHHWHEASCKIESHREDKAEHKWDNGVVTKQPTETDDGETTYTCEVCGHTKTDTITALGHIHTISDKWTTNETHHWHEASCKIESHREDKAEHKLDDGVVTKQPTETDDGEIIYTCEVCGHTKTDTITALGHSHTISDKWTNDETHHWHEASCKIESHREGKAEHKWDNGVVTKQPTETDDGEITYTCTDCGHTKTDRITALGHIHTISDKWANDETHHWHEASCKIESHREDKAEHKWDDGVVITEPKVGIAGERKRTCTVCAMTKTEEVPALTPTPEGTILPNYSEISFLLVSSENVEISKVGNTYQVAPMQKIKVAVKNSSGDDITNTIKSSTITLYHNGDEVTVKHSSSGDAIFIPDDAVGKGYTLIVTVTTSNSVSYDKTISIDIVKNLEIPDSDKREYEALHL